MTTTSETIEQADMVPVAQFMNLQEAQEYALVVLAMNLSCLITTEENRFTIHAEKAFAVAVQEEFTLYAQEQEEAQSPTHIPVFGSGIELALIWIVSLFFCYVLQLESPDFTENYLNSSIAVIQHGEVYRSFTALFLHGDLGHLLSNIGFGLIFCIFVAHVLGPRTGWLLILASGFFGNFINAALHASENFRSLGASTATFGALGLLVGAGFYQALSEHSWRSGLRAVLPLVAGMMLFSLMGVGGPETDIMGHVLGLVCGIALGFPTAVLRQRQSLQAQAS